MIPPKSSLPEGKKIYFASDFHLGVPNKIESKKRENKIVRWLSEIEEDAAAIFILGDIFDFWFEYKYTVPKGYIKFLGKLAFIREKGIPVYFFTGNHDMWMFDYFPTELDIPVFYNSQQFEVNGIRFFVGHGDGLGPGDHFYKIIKKVFANRLCQQAFSLIPPYIGMGIANFWSRKSRISNVKKDDIFLNEKEWLYQFCIENECRSSVHFYIFGHRHLPLRMRINQQSEYVNLGEWVNFFTYAVFDGKNLDLKKFEST